ncbi:hypothetical protein FRACA_320020 [Frankia canadensis]|uniref:AMP-binding enzyme C-terminal domain-containing protein n=1 Tax=Frankia canadensis TaxID=1836972 RepID=A0A2I2KUI5_9ACTN|nr:hypothetical protein [Frankia canadensis]SNQ49321.1 hypothetical protein FRACA_320020 [Frankia canadensis]SOU56611.1 hypothetical protein FRACA_320020 [Frankia canadensis]
MRRRSPAQPAPGRTIDEEELEAFARAYLASFKVPRRWRVLEQFPRTAMGKIRKVDLAALLRTG